MNESDVDTFLANVRLFRTNGARLIEMMQGGNRNDRRHAKHQFANNKQLHADLVEVMQSMVELGDQAVLVVGYLRHRPAADDGAPGAGII